MAQLPAWQAEAILINTLRMAWQQVAQSTLTNEQILTKVLGIAIGEGLPTGFLKVMWSKRV